MRCLWSVLAREERAKSQTPTFWGTNMVICLTVDTSALRGRTIDGGDIRLLGIKILGGVCPEEGGPWAPPPRNVHPQRCMVFCLVFWPT